MMLYPNKLSSLIDGTPSSQELNLRSYFSTVSLGIEPLSYFYEQLPYFLSEIFGSPDNANKKCWIQRAYEDSVESEALLRVINSSSDFFKVLEKNSIRDERYYNFPVAVLPDSIQKRLYSETPNQTVPFLHSRLQHQKQYLFIKLNMLEYYICYFAYFGLKDSGFRSSAPIRSPSPKKFDKSPYDLRLPGLFSAQVESKPITPTLKPPTYSPYIVLLESYLEFFFPISGHKHPLASNFLRILIELYTDHIPPKTEVKTNPLLYTLESSSSMPTTGIPLSNSNTNPSNSPTPTESCIALTKHISKFSFTSTTPVYMTPLEANPSQTQTLFDYIQRPMYEAIKQSLHRNLLFSANHSFTPIIELWVSYIFPWVYFTDQSRVFVLDKWKDFIFNNFLFYGQLFQDYIVLAGNYSYGKSSNDISDLKRVIEGFHTPGLIEYLLDVERKVLDVQKETNNSLERGLKRMEDYAFRDKSQREAFYESNLLLYHLQLESKGYTYYPLRNENNLRFIRSIMAKLKRESHDHYIPPVPVNSPPSATFTYRHETIPTPNEKKILEAIEKIGSIFGIADEAKKLVAAAPIEPIPLDLLAKRPETQPDRVRLTENGRSQVRKGMRKCTNIDTAFLGKDSDRPICSYEIAWLVRRLHALEKRLNSNEAVVNQYSSFLSSLHKLVPSVIPPPSTSKATSQPPYEIQLRFLGSKRFWIRVFVLLFMFFIIWKILMYGYCSVISETCE